MVLEQAKLIDLAFNNLEREVESLTGLHKGHIRIGLPPIIDSYFSLQLIGRFHKDTPILYQLVEYGSKKIEEAVENDLLDIGVIVLPTNPELFSFFLFIRRRY